MHAFAVTNFIAQTQDYIYVQWLYPLGVYSDKYFGNQIANR